MYTSYIGRRFLALWNERTGRDLSARQFFDEELHPVFFAHDKYLQWVPNSPFAQKVAQKDLVPGTTAAVVQLEKLHRNVRELAPDASFVIGFPAAGTTGTTSGQVSGVGPRVAPDDVYCSWIGGALGVGVSGGLTLLLDEDEVLWALYEGWKMYRTLLGQYDGLKGNQIETWNGRWLTHALDEEFNPRQPLANFRFDEALDTKEGSSALKTQAWVKVLFALARHYKQRLTVYVYSLAQTNRTIGFVPLELEAVEDMYQLSQRLFQLSPDIRDWEKVKNMYETHLGFARACQLGSIGLAAIEPAKLQDYLPGNDKKINLKTTADRLQFDIYQLWILAMLSNQALDDAATSLADVLFNFANSNSRGKTTNAQAIKPLWGASNRKMFVVTLNQFMEKGADAYDTFSDIVSKSHSVPSDQFPFFIALVHFRYLIKSRKPEELQDDEQIS
jgi:hypothetical protein